MLQRAPLGNLDEGVGWLLRIDLATDTEAAMGCFCCLFDSLNGRGCFKNRASFAQPFVSSKREEASLDLIDYPRNRLLSQPSQSLCESRLGLKCQSSSAAYGWGRGDAGKLRSLHEVTNCLRCSSSPQLLLNPTHERRGWGGVSRRVAAQLPEKQAPRKVDGLIPVRIMRTRKTCPAPPPYPSHCLSLH